MINLFRRFDIKPTLRAVVCLLVLLAFAVSASAQEKSTIQASFATNQAPVKIDVLVGQSRVIEFDQDYERLSISDPKIAEVVPINYKQALINGLTFGQVNLVAWAKRKDPTEVERLVVFDIYVQVNLSLIDNQIKILFPKENIQLSQANNSVVLSGSVTKPELADQVQKIIEAAGLKVTNLLKGPITDAAQVQLQVRVAEVNRQVLREVATAYGVLNTALPVFISAAGPATFGGLVVKDEILKSSTGSIIGKVRNQELLSSPTSTMNVFLGNANNSAISQAFVRALYSRGALRDLAEPNLIAMHGQKASFLAGGEFPIPVIQSVNQGQTAITVIFKSFGVQLEFTPTIVDENHIRLELAPEVSSLDFASGVTIQGLIIPGLRVRRAKTVLELRDGQSFALAGLIDNTERVNLSKVPLLGDIPIVGELFKSRSFQRNETELLFLATVKLVEPLNPDQLPRLPGVSELKPVGQGPTGTAPAGSIEGQSGHSVPRKAGEQPETQSKTGTDTPSGKKGKAASDSVAGTVGQVSLPVAPVNQTESAPATQSGVIGPVGSDVPTAKSVKSDKPETKDTQKDPSQPKDVKP
ncbi:MAG TPA: pilus assembly protein N-terminal domain-containing protein [Blastocatellia bacterium]|nr:pilus assembly protein N-terminal domain-containing protein [Blastocatellia bacterium]HMX24546.1 pilus assembly protein N-terminal domain-containing protein [Blastocatellia bacterium]HMZ17186.1 pilus assembly protein N-terminal domain-containing protein [Blastocatellia bacterium]HNG31879.1 pilus assembly protein N-terminal domain-containing protein [Blastocatellia bacterium]